MLRNMNSEASAQPLEVTPWLTKWSEETIVASIATGGKTHLVTRTVWSNNREERVTDPNAKRRPSFRTECGTVRASQFRRFNFDVAATDGPVTCDKCAKYGRS